MRTRRRATIEDLRLAIDCLPRAHPVAHARGHRRATTIIVGAYSTGDGICPMLAGATAPGGRTET